MYGKSSHSEHFSNHCTNSLSPLVIIPISSTSRKFRTNTLFFPKVPAACIHIYSFPKFPQSATNSTFKPWQMYGKSSHSEHFSNHCTDCLSSLVIIPISSKSRKFRTTTYIFSQSSCSVHTNIFFPKVPAECNELKLGRCMESSNFEQTYTFFPKVPAACIHIYSFPKFPQSATNSLYENLAAQEIT